MGSILSGAEYSASTGGNCVPLALRPYEVPERHVVHRQVDEAC